MADPLTLFLAGVAGGVALARERERRIDAALFDLLRPEIQNTASPSTAELRPRDQRDHDQHPT